MGKLRYIDTRPLFFPKGALKFYPNGIVVPDGKNEIQVTDDEQKMLLRQKNGNKACWETIRERAVKEDIE